ncbi:uncharacterized protein LOC129611738 [Condylostylus longicornis]|uniref:uncharacterized protein LOC129611738 n=1 Tax=Condylostylus longicornis TaxID=2530218 RepID=UPI00244E4B89|nr:uncharacterized protein LOC129611738 [Condylostylus longicornis]
MYSVPFFVMILFISVDNAFSSKESDALALALKTSIKVNSTLSTLPPLIFPDKSSNFTIIPPNEATIRRLQHMDSQDTTSRPKPEIQKVISNRQGIALFRVKNMDIDNLPEVFPSDLENDFKEVKELKDEVEEIQEDDFSEEQSGFEERFGNRKTGIQEIFNEDIEVHNVNFTNHHLTIILATFLGLICLAVYIALLTWRQYLKKRYGMRQLLVTDDEFLQNHDQRSFNV